MPVWPPQNTGIFDYKMPCGGPVFWLEPDVKQWIAATTPTSASWISPTITFTPRNNQGKTLTFVSAAFVGYQSFGYLISGPPTITQISEFQFTIGAADPGNADWNLIAGALQVQYTDEDGNTGVGYASVFAFTGTSGASFTQLTSASGIPANMNAAGALDATSSAFTFTPPDSHPGARAFQAFGAGYGGAGLMAPDGNPLEVTTVGGSHAPGSGTTGPCTVTTDYPTYDPNAPNFYEETYYGFFSTIYQDTSSNVYYWMQGVPCNFTMTGGSTCK